MIDGEAYAVPELDYAEPPSGSDRRSFMMRSAMAAAVVALGGRANPLWAQTPAGPPLGSTPVDPEPAGGQEDQGSGDDAGRRVLQGRARARRARTRSARCGSPTTSTSAARSCRPTSSRRRPRSRCTCSAASAPPARATAPSARRSAGIIGKEPATIDPAFLDNLAAQAGPELPGEARQQDVQRVARRTSSTTRRRATSRIRTR